MAIRIGQSAEADRYRLGGDRYRGPIFGQQQPQLSMSIPTGGFMGQNQIGGQSSINVFRKPPPPLTPEQEEEKMLEDRARQYQQGLAELELGQREDELEQRRTDAEQIARGKHTIDGRPVSAREMFEVTGNYYQQDYVTPPKVTPEQARANSVQQSFEQFIQDPMQFIFGGGQNVGEVLNYVNQLNQLFNYSGQEGNFMDFLFGSSRASSGNVPTQSRQNRAEVSNQQRQDLARREEEKRKSRSYQPSDYITPLTPFMIADAPIATQTPRQNNTESASARLARLGIRPKEQSQILEALGPRGRGTFVSSAFAQR
jgi:hypothetical protein